jgi:GGDEF domain-containing protein
VVVIAVVAVLVAVVASVVADRSRRAAEQRAAQAEDHMHAAQARLGVLTVQVDALEAALAEAREQLEAAPAASAPETPAHLTGTDPVTGLLGEAYFDITLERLVAAAKRHLRPVAVVLLEVAPTGADPLDAGAVASLLVDTLRDADIACRLPGEGCFGVVLEDTPENGAVWSVERFRRAMAGQGGTHLLRAGIACYPAHAFDAAELRIRAAEALDAARQWRQDRIEVATASEV